MSTINITSYIQPTAHCTATPLTIDTTTENVITITTDKGYRFNDNWQTTFYISATYASGTFRYNASEINEAKTEIKITITAEDSQNIRRATLWGGYAIQSAIPITETLVENCSYTPTEIDVEQETVIITIAPNEGYMFRGNTPYLSCIYSPNNTEQVFTATIDSETGNATIEVTGTNLLEASLTALAVVAESVSYGFVNVYGLDEATFLSLANKRFYGVKDDPLSNEFIDLGVYVTSLKRFFCPLPLTTQKQSIYLGVYNTNIECSLISEAIHLLKFGKIEIAGYYSNSVDFQSTLYAQLPFVGYVELTTKKYMDRAVELYYYVDTVSGYCTAVLSVEGIAVDKFVGNISQNIPYIISYGSTLTQDFSQTSYYGTNASIISITPKIYDDKAIISDKKRIRINEASGFCSFENVVSDSVINETILDMIKTQLRNGIII